MTDSKTKEPQPDFSLVGGGPLYRFWRWANLSGTDLEMTARRILVAVAVTWIPLLALSLLDGTALNGKVAIPFFLDAAAQGRFLIGLPLLLCADRFSHTRAGPSMKNFLDRDIIAGDETRKYEEAIDRAHRVRDSVWLEVGIAIAVLTVGVLSWRSQMAMAAPSWFATPDGTHLNLTLPGYWLTFVSVPIFQFILIRWYARFLIWFVFLWSVSRLKLDLIPTHPDETGGIGFLVRATYPFAFVLMTQGVMLSALVANLVLHNGRDLMEFRIQVAGYVIFFIALAVSPLTVFILPLVDAKRRGLNEYGSLATQYTRDFRKKWIEGVNPDCEDLLGNHDIQSLADLVTSYQKIRDMKLAPFGIRATVWLAAATAVPLLPLSLFVFSPAQLVEKLLKVIL